MTKREKWVCLSAGLIIAVCVNSSGAFGQKNDQGAAFRSRPSPAAQFMASTAHPIAIGHHGMGESGDPSLPTENTIASVQMAYNQGVSVVEVDVQITRDGKVAVYHDDFLPDWTCLNTLTLEQLQARVPYIPSLEAITAQARQAHIRRGGFHGVLIVELKASSPYCDPTDDEDIKTVSSVLRVIDDTHTQDLVIFDSLSPTLLVIAGQAAPQIPRELDISILQLATPEQVTAETGLPVTIIQKQLGLGLTWAEIGALYRLPGYANIEEFLGTAFYTGIRAVGLDLQVLGMAEQSGSAANLVSAVHSLGMKEFAWTITNQYEWGFAAAVGSDAIYTDDIPMGLALEAPH